MRGAFTVGDANQDLSFDQLDLVRVLQAGKYMTLSAATWGEGDWDGAPGGEPGAPPVGDGWFNQMDILAALQGGVYLTGPCAGQAPLEGEAIAVPEPAALLLATFGLFGFLGHRARRAKL